MGRALQREERCPGPAEERRGLTVMARPGAVAVPVRAGAWAGVEAARVRER